MKESCLECGAVFIGFHFCPAHDALVYGLGFQQNGVRVDPRALYLVDGGAAIAAWPTATPADIELARQAAQIDMAPGATTESGARAVPSHQREFDDREQPPADLVRAAHLLHRWFEERNMDEWACGPIMTRFQNGKDLFPTPAQSRAPSL